MFDPRNAEPSAAPTSAELMELIRKTLDEAGYCPDYVAGYIAAQQADGCLRSHAPQWMRKAMAARMKALAASAIR